MKIVDIKKKKNLETQITFFLFWFALSSLFLFLISLLQKKQKANARSPFSPAPNYDALVSGHETSRPSAAAGGDAARPHAERVHEESGNVRSIFFVVVVIISVVLHRFSEFSARAAVYKQPWNRSGEFSCFFAFRTEKRNSVAEGQG